MDYVYIFENCGGGVAVEKLRGGLVQRRWPCGGLILELAGWGLWPRRPGQRG